MGCHFLLQGIFSTQESNLHLLCLLHCKRILYQLSHRGSPRILEWAACPFCRASSQPRSRTRFSCIAAAAAHSLQSCPTLCDPIGGSPPGSPIPGIFQARVLEWGAIAFSDGLYSPWNSPGQNAGVGSLSLLQGIFPTQGSNPGLLHCRQTVYQPNDKGSPVSLHRRIKLDP